MGSGVDIKPEALRQARTRARLSLSQVAGNELSRQTVHLIEIGKNRPSMRSLRVITERLAIPIREVLVGPPESTWDERAVNELEALIRSYHYDQALEQGGEFLHQVQEPPARALVHLHLGRALCRLRRPTEALEQLNLAEELFVSLGNQERVAEATELQALALHVAEQPQALSVAEQALDRYRALPQHSPEVESRLLERLGTILTGRGDFLSARAQYEEALERASGVRGVNISARELRQARARAQLSLAQVGGNELTRQAVHLIETGKVRPSMHSLRVITDRLAIPIDAVLIRPRGRRAGVDIKSEVLQQARARAQLSLAQVGGNDLTRQAVHLIETGKVRPSMHSLRLITDRLAIPINAVLIGPPESTYPRSSRPPPSTAEQLQNGIQSVRRQRQAAELARTRTMVRELTRAREQAGITQAQVANQMGTTQSVVARLERAEMDLRLSTLVRYAAAVGRRIRIG